MLAHNSSTTKAAPHKKAGKRNIWRVIRKYTTVEIVVVCYALPTFLNAIAVQNLALEKACRVNLHDKYSDEVCDNMINKELNNIDCVKVRDKLLLQNETHLVKEDVFNNTHFLNFTEISSKSDNKTVIVDLTMANVTACQAETDSQALETEINDYMKRVEILLGLLAIGGAWSDKRGRRKPIMLIPMIAQSICAVALFIIAVFFNQLPMEFHIILVKVISALSGGLELLTLGIFSYLTEITKETSRLFRFAVLMQFIQIFFFISKHFANVLYTWLGYSNLFLLGIPINVIGVLYVIFVLKEVERKPDIELKRVDNPTFQNKNETEGNSVARDNEIPPNGCLIDLFDPSLVVHRENGEQEIIIFLVILYLVSAGVISGESQYEKTFLTLKLNAEEDFFTSLNTYSTVMPLFGTMFVIFFLKKLLKCSDPFIAIVGTVMSGIARVFYILATSEVHIFIGKAFEASDGLRSLVVQAVLSTIVDVNEIARAFAVLVAAETFFSPMYKYLYNYVYDDETFKYWRAGYFGLSLIFFGILLICFIILFFIVKSREKRIVKELEEQKRKEMLDNVDLPKFTSFSETTHL